MNKKIVFGIIAIILFFVGIFALDPKEYSNLKKFVEENDVRTVVAKLENGEVEELNGVAYPNYIEVSNERETVVLEDDNNEFYVSIAPYFDTTHS